MRDRRTNSKWVLYVRLLIFDIVRTHFLEIYLLYICYIRASFWKSFCSPDFKSLYSFYNKQIKKKQCIYSWVFKISNNFFNINLITNKKFICFLKNNPHFLLSSKEKKEKIKYILYNTYIKIKIWFLLYKKFDFYYTKTCIENVDLFDKLEDSSFVYQKLTLYLQLTNRIIKCIYRNNLK